MQYIVENYFIIPISTNKNAQSEMSKYR